VQEQTKSRAAREIDKKEDRIFETMSMPKYHTKIKISNLFWTVEPSCLPLGDFSLPNATPAVYK